MAPIPLPQNECLQMPFYALLSFLLGAPLSALLNVSLSALLSAH